jgi:hypothetical protein
MDLPIIVPLTRPIVLGDQTFDALSFDEPDLDTQIAYAELEASLPEPEKVEQPDGSTAEVHSAITAAKVNRFWLARLAGVSEQVVGKVKDSDLAAVNAAAEAVMGIAAGEGDGAGDAPGNATPAK